jgi:hypothetical protein
MIVFTALSAAVSGNSGGSALAPASYDPNANFTYQS